MKDMYFEGCFSLGWFCGTASAMGKLGLRSVSGPFDWYWSDYWAVIDQMKNRFVDFLNITNQVVDENNPRRFRDIRYGFTYLHDVDSNFYDEYDLIVEKYQKRIDRFLSNIEKPTLFFRCVRDKSEIEYINSDWEYIEAVLKEFNTRNKVIYVLPHSMGELNKSVMSFQLPIEYYVPKTLEMMYLFNESDELMSFCSNVLDYKIIKDNKLFDTQKYYRKEKIAIFVKELMKNNEFINLFGNKGDMEKGIYVFGAGVYGRTMVKFFKNNHYPILAIIDNNMFGTVDDIPIIKPYEATCGKIIFIAIESKIVSDRIVKQLRDMHYDGIIITFDDIIVNTKLEYRKELLDWHLNYIS